MLGLLARIGFALADMVGLDDKIGAKGLRVVGGIAIFVVLLVLLAIGKCSYDQNVIARYEAPRQAQVATEARAADHAADNAVEASRNDFDKTTEKVKETTSDAKRAEPAKAATPVGPVQSGYFDSLPRKTDNGRTPVRRRKTASR